jgi:hypothetical protein
MTLADLRAAVETAGLALRGGFRLTETERAGPLAHVSSVLLLGFVGAEQWPTFAASPEAADGRAHPLDRWSRRVVTALAERLGALALFPFEGPPYWPFQAWAQRAEPVFPSPLGMLIHPQYGLSHSYCGALALAQRVKFPPREPSVRPCESCEARPCLTACPVSAFSALGYDVGACVKGLGREGEECLGGGCLARRACPVGRNYAQAPEQARFHMAAFLAAREQRGEG